MILKNILEQLASAERPVAKIIKHTDRSKTIAIALKKGMIWPDHKAALPTTLLVVQGHVIYKQDEQTVELGIYDDMEIPVDLVHSLQALEDSMVILLQG